jgi:phage shock protein E
MNSVNNSLEKQGTVVDVRTVEEFEDCHVAGSINIPLQEIPARIAELKNLPSPLVLCCASGNRSEQAYRYLVRQGIESVNGGSWLDVSNSQFQKTV